MTEHDIPLTAIVTPETMIAATASCKRPKRIYWEMLSPEKIDAIPVLQERRRRNGVR